MSDFDLATVDRLLSTTRAVRKRLDLERPVPREVVLDCIRLSQQAPTASNTQRWRWLLIDDPALRRELGRIYADGMPAIRASAKQNAHDDQTRDVYEVALWFAERLGDVPLLAIPCLAERIPESAPLVLTASTFGSIYPAVWSFQLALRSRGLGSTFTTLHLLFEKRVRELLHLPDDVTQTALLPVAYTKGLDFKPGRRPPVESIVRWNLWDSSEGSSA
jgi:nitroreductase